MMELKSRVREKCKNFVVGNAPVLAYRKLELGTSTCSAPQLGETQYNAHPVVSGRAGAGQPVEL